MVAKIKIYDSEFLFNKYIHNYNYFTLPTPIFLDKSNVRIFYGKRNKDIKTNIFFFDLNIDNFKINKISTKPSLMIGNKGTFFQDGIYPSTIVKKNNTYYL